MAATSDSGIQDQAAYEIARGRDGAPAQRWVLLSGGTVYALGTLLVSLRVGTDTAFAAISFGLLAAMALVYGLTYLSDPRIRLLFVPALTALLFAFHIVFGVAYAPAGGALRAAFLLTLLGISLVLLAPTWRGYLFAQIIAVLVAAYGVLAFWPSTGVPISALHTLAYWLPALAATLAGARILEGARRAAFRLGLELAQRANATGTGASA